MPLLTILIPNFNQRELLARTLTSIVNWHSGSSFSSEVEVIVSDNNSDDGSSALLKKVDLSILQVVFQEKNLGFPGNFWFLAEQSSGTWITFIGSGELVDSAELDAMLAILKGESESKDVVQAIVLDGDGSTSVHPDELPFNLSIAGNFFRLEKVIGGPKELEGFRWGAWPHVYLALSILGASGQSAHARHSHRPFSIDQSGGWWLTADAWRHLIELDPMLRWGIRRAHVDFVRAFRRARARQRSWILPAWITRARLASGVSPTPMELFGLTKLCLPNFFSLILVFTASLAPLPLLALASRAVSGVGKLVAWQPKQMS